MDTEILANDTSFYYAGDTVFKLKISMIVSMAKNETVGALMSQLQKQQRNLNSFF
jgi:hypothetical protein